MQFAAFKTNFVSLTYSKVVHGATNDRISSLQHPTTNYSNIIIVPICFKSFQIFLKFMKYIFFYFNGFYLSVIRLISYYSVSRVSRLSTLNPECWLTCWVNCLHQRTAVSTVVVSNNFIYYCFSLVLFPCRQFVGLWETKYRA